MNSAFVLEIRQVLADNANPRKAEGMRAYMKSEMRFHGVQKPLRRRLFREALQAYPITEKEAWSDAVLDLWGSAGYREERYVALELAGAKRYFPFRDLETVAMFEEMVVTGAWRDFVDEVATQNAGCELEYPTRRGETGESRVSIQTDVRVRPFAM